MTAVGIAAGDLLILSCVTHEWQKMACIVGKALCI
jgi:hypothetical protein